jgi:hypothetical protein
LPPASLSLQQQVQTCVWRKPNDDMTLAEWDKTLPISGSGRSLPSPANHLCAKIPSTWPSAYQHCRPAVITIPTNGILTRQIIDQVDRLCAGAPKAAIGINLSLDEVGERHDEIRMVSGNWNKAIKTWTELKALQKQHKNLVLTNHTVISNYNIDRFFEIYTGLEFLEPDSYITEIAEERVDWIPLAGRLLPWPRNMPR